MVSLNVVPQNHRHMSPYSQFYFLIHGHSYYIHPPFMCARPEHPKLFGLVRSCDSVDFLALRPYLIKHAHHKIIHQNWQYYTIIIRKIAYATSLLNKSTHSLSSLANITQKNHTAIPPILLQVQEGMQFPPKGNSRPKRPASKTNWFRVSRKLFPEYRCEENLSTILN